MAQNHQNYYFTALLVGNISFISVLSKFEFFNWRKIKYVINHMIKYYIKYSKDNTQNWVVFKHFSEKVWVCKIKNRSEIMNYFLFVCYFQKQEKSWKS